MLTADRTANVRHIRHAGRIIDASWHKGRVAYYVVQGGAGRYYSLKVAKEVAEALGRRK